MSYACQLYYQHAIYIPLMKKNKVVMPNSEFICVNTICAIQRVESDPTLATTLLYLQPECIIGHAHIKKPQGSSDKNVMACKCQCSSVQAETDCK